MVAVDWEPVSFSFTVPESDLMVLARVTFRTRPLTVPVATVLPLLLRTVDLAGRACP